MWGYAAIGRSVANRFEATTLPGGCWAVACRVRIYPQGNINRFSESKGYAPPEGFREQMLFNGAGGC